MIRIIKLMLLLAILSVEILFSQIGTTIPTARRGNWQNAGYTGIIPTSYDYQVTVNGYYYNAILNAVNAAKAYIDANPTHRALVILPPGNYNVHRPIVLNSNYTRITIRGQILADGTRAVLRYWFDPAYPDSNYSGASYSDLHSLFRILGTNQIGIENLGITAEDLSTEYTTILRLSKNLHHNILITNSNNCWIKNIESIKPFKQHLAIGNGNNIEIRHCYFREAYSYGVGGSGYGVNITTNSFQCLVENNVFKELRHAMVVANGAHDNVFGYNYSCQQTDEIGNVLADICIHGHTPSTVGPYKNLFEGNRVDRIHADMYHGYNGSYNTFFRNFMYYGTIKIETARLDEPDSILNSSDFIPNNYYNIIGNEAKTIYFKFNADGSTTNVTIPWQTLDVYGTNNYYFINSGVQKLSAPAPQKLFAHENWTINFENDNYLDDISYYKTTRPSFIPAAEFSWPPLGPPTNPSALLTQNIPARVRACDSLDILCTADERFHYLSKNNNSSSKSKIKNGKLEYALSQNYPNPFNPSTQIKYTIPNKSYVHLKIYNTLGEEVKVLVDGVRLEGTYEIQFDAVDLPSGVYFCLLQVGSYLESRKMILLK